MFSVCPHLVRGGGVPRPGPDGEGGTPARSDGERYPSQGVAHPGYPLARSGWGVPQPGGPPANGTLPPRDRTAHGVLDKPRSVYLLRSRRRTVLLSTNPT